jgi:hypothetical protein
VTNLNRLINRGLINRGRAGCYCVCQPLFGTDPAGLRGNAAGQIKITGRWHGSAKAPCHRATCRHWRSDMAQALAGSAGRPGIFRNCFACWPDTGRICK